MELSNNFSDRNKTVNALFPMRNGTPGPGSYRIMSEFGKYDLNQTSPALLDTSATTPIKRAFSAMGGRRQKKAEITFQEPISYIAND